MNRDELYMRRALELARRGQGAVSPNPMVGCVIVHDEQIIGEGWHMLYGGPHAEVNAIRNVQDKQLLPESTVYVTLEPCSHFGKTPPCADLLMENKVKKVVICNLDTNPLVAGKGVAKLQKAGIEVVSGVLEAEGRKLNKRFFTFMEQKRPYIILKWAETADGFVARENFDSKWISNAFSRQMVHRLRAEEDAILVGTRTAEYDNPQLNVRNWSGKNPLRLVIDKQLRLSPKLKLFDGTLPTICYNLHKTEEKAGYSLVALPEEVFLESLLSDLYQRKVQSLIVEGGSTLLKAFIEKGLWDEAMIFKAPVTFGKGIQAPLLRGTLVDEKRILDNSLFNYELRITN
jgi:diaminohydroxyphosphoribosylaminopyrimidine deaminase / 5-amino-6-(5-phosphoribosylamino)uracil reductase